MERGGFVMSELKVAFEKTAYDAAFHAPHASVSPTPPPTLEGKIKEAIDNQ